MSDDKDQLIKQLESKIHHLSKNQDQSVDVRGSLTTPAFGTTSSNYNSRGNRMRNRSADILMMEGVTDKQHGSSSSNFFDQSLLNNNHQSSHNNLHNNNLALVTEIFQMAGVKTYGELISSFKKMNKERKVSYLF